MLITKMDNQGRGITYFNDKIVFVNNALINEDVELNITLNKKRYSIANVAKYNCVSKKRVKPFCKYYGKCGGCQLQHLSYEDQIKYKRDYLTNLFSNQKIKIEEIITENYINYRNKITLKVNNKIGFFKLNSNDLIAIDSCKIAQNILNSKIKVLNELNLSKVEEFVLKSCNNKLLLCINGDKNLKLDKILHHFDTIYLNDKLIKGNRLTVNLENLKYYISPNGFFQVNTVIATKMFNYIKNICYNIKSKKVLDLYCGCGSISLFISDIVDAVFGVEVNKDSIKDANDNKKLNGIKNVNFLCDTTDNIKNINHFDTIIIDPPRSGLSKKIITKILQSNVCNIIYVSCEPLTLKRDLSLLKSKYNINNIRPFDMFPNTYHVECVCLLKLR